MARDPASVLSSLNASVIKSLGHEAELQASRENPGGWMFVHLVDQNKAFDERLDPDEEIGGYLPAGVGADAFHILGAP